MAANPSTATGVEHPFSPGEVRILGSIAGAIIGPSDEHGLPGADDETILNVILRRAAKHEAFIRDAIREFKVSESPVTLMASRKDLASLMTVLVAQAYYGDTRVLRSLGMESRPPFPKGHVVEQGNWSLLEPVKRKGKLYRDPPATGG